MSPGPWRRRRRIGGAVAIGAVLVTAAVAVVASVGLGSPDRAAQVDSQAPLSTVRVTQQDLIDEVVLDGEVGYGTGAPVAAKLTGTVTWLAPVGSTVKRGGPLLRVDDRPVVLLIGPLPMYRTLTKNLKGRDVQQFETNLSALGYTGFTVDDTYSVATVAAVKRWQSDLGVRPTGSVELGWLIYGPGSMRIGGHLVRIGAEAAGDVLTYTGTTRVVTVEAQAGSAGWAIKGTKVTVQVPDGRSVAGTIATVESAASNAGSAGGGDAGSGSGEGRQTDASAPVRITIKIGDQRALGKRERGTVEVTYVAKERKGVLTVPVSALVALAEGGYGLELVEGSSSRFVAVRVGLFAAGLVEVEAADLRDGAMVRIPA